MTPERGGLSDPAIAARVRKAIDSMPAGDGEADNGERLIMASAANGPVVKVTRRLPPAHARRST